MKLKTQYEKIFFEGINKDIGNSINVGNKLRTFEKIKSYHLEEFCEWPWPSLFSPSWLIQWSMGKGSYITLFSPSDVTAFQRMKYGGGVLYDLVFTEWRHCVSQNIYIRCDMKANFKKLIAQIRLSSHDLKLAKGRRCDQNLHRRFCHFCKNKAEDEVHFAVDCPTYSEIHQEFHSAYAKGVSSALIFVSIFKSRNKATLLNFGQFIENALSMRRELTERQP